MQTVISTIAIGGEDSSAAMMSFSVPLVTELFQKWNRKMESRSGQSSRD